MAQMNKNKFLFTLIIIGIAFFVIGFGVGINGIMVPILESAFNLSKGMSYLVLTATYSAFLIFGGPSGWVVKKIGYKKSLILALFVMSMGMLLFIPSAKMGSSMSGFYMFLVASFIGGMGNTLLQATINPFVAICGPIEKTAQRMSAMGILNKSAWYLGPIFLSLFIDVKQPDIAQAAIPFGIAAAIIALFALSMFWISFPEITAKGESETDEVIHDEYVIAANRKTSVWQFPHLVLGAITLFVYLGVETLTMASAIDFAKSSGLDNPEQYSAFVPLGLVIGYVVCIFLLQWVSQIRAMVWFVVIALISSIMLVTLPAKSAIFFLAGLGFSHSIMWGAVWGIAIDRLGKFTKSGASLLVVAIVGGAIVPLIFGFIQDAVESFQTAYWLLIPCYLFILYYALAGHKLGLKKS